MSKNNGSTKKYAPIQLGPKYAIRLADIPSKIAKKLKFGFSGHQNDPCGDSHKYNTVIKKKVRTANEKTNP